MQIRFAAIGGVDVDGEILEAGVKALGGLGDFEEVPYSPDAEYTIRIHPAWTGKRSTWSLVEIDGEDSVSTFLGVARAVARHTEHDITAVASGVERQRSDGRIEVGYRAYEIERDGSWKSVINAEADRVCSLEVDEDSLDEMGDILTILLGDSAAHAVHPPSAGRCFRHKPLFEDHRLSRLANSILAAKAVSFAPDANDRVRLSLEGHDGTKQISLVSPDEAEQLRRATDR